MMVAKPDPLEYSGQEEKNVYVLQFYYFCSRLNLMVRITFIGAASDLHSLDETVLFNNIWISVNSIFDVIIYEAWNVLVN